MNDDHTEHVPTTPAAGDQNENRWSWRSTSYRNFDLLNTLDLPLQQVFCRGLKVGKLREPGEPQTEPSQSNLNAAMAALQLRHVRSSTAINPELRTETNSIRKIRSELSGEWTRVKNYICSPCGHIFQDFLSLQVSWRYLIFFFFKEKKKEK